MNRNLFYILSTVLSAGAVFGCNYLLSQNLTIADYGIFGLITALIPAVLPFVVFGQPAALTSVYFSDQKAHSKSIGREVFVSLSIMAACTVVFLIAFTLYFFITGAYLGSLLITTLFLLAAVTEALRIFVLSLLNCLDNYRIYFYSVLIYGTSLLSIALFNPNLVGALSGYIIGGLACFTLAGNIVIKMSKPVFSPVKFKALVKKLIGLGWYSIPGMVVASLALYLDRYIINYAFSAQELGLYTLASTLSVGVGGVLVNSLLKGNTILLLKALQEQDKNSYQVIIKNISFFFSLIAIAGSVFAYFLMEFAVTLIFGDKFNNASVFIFPLFLNVLINGMAQFIGSCLVQKKQLKQLLMINVTTIVLNLVLSLILATFIGIIGVIISGFITAFFNCYLTIYNAKKLFSFVKLPVYFTVIFIPIFSFNIFVGGL